MVLIAMVNKKLREIKQSLFGKPTEVVPIVGDNSSDEYIELEPGAVLDRTAKIFVKYFVLTEYTDIKPILDSLRDGYTIAMVKIGPLRAKDIVELKRAVSKIKKTTDAIDGDVVGIDEDWIVAVPGFVQVYRGETTPTAE
jgi:SepF-like predicted cell division protein (DUF552 family)